MPIVAAFHFEFFLTMLVWAVLLVLNLWLFQKSKAKGNLLMLVGGALLTLAYAIWTFSNFPGEFVIYWLPLLGAAGVVAGFYLTVQSLVAANIAGLKAKAQQAMQKKETPGGTAPPSP